MTHKVPLAAQDNHGTRSSIEDSIGVGARPPITSISHSTNRILGAAETKIEIDPHPGLSAGSIRRLQRRTTGLFCAFDGTTSSTSSTINSAMGDAERRRSRHDLHGNEDSPSARISANSAICDVGHSTSVNLRRTVSRRRPRLRRRCPSLSLLSPSPSQLGGSYSTMRRNLGLGCAACDSRSRKGAVVGLSAKLADDGEISGQPLLSASSALRCQGRPLATYQRRGDACADAPWSLTVSAIKASSSWRKQAKMVHHVMARGIMSKTGCDI